VTQDGSTRKDNPFARRSKPLNVGKRPSARKKNRLRAEIEDGLEEFYLSDTERPTRAWHAIEDDTVT
jgi:hypothetical protein